MSNAPNVKETRRSEEEQTASREVGKFMLTLGVLGATGYFLWHGGNFGVQTLEVPQFVDVRTTNGNLSKYCGPPTADRRAVIVDMLYGDSKRAWIEDAVGRFTRLCPNIQVKLTAMGDLESADAILNGAARPTLWAPTDDIVVRYLEARWKGRSSEVLLGADEQQSLARSPLVMLVWEDQYRVLDTLLRARRSDEGPWAQTACALVPRDPGLDKVAREDMVPGRWIDWYGPLVPPPPTKKPAPAAKKPAETTPASEVAFPTLDEITRWGRVKFGHTSPTRSASGLEALYLMAYDYTVPPKERAAPEGSEVLAAAPASPGHEGSITGSEQLRSAFEHALAAQKDSLRRWLRRCEAGLDEAPKSTHLFTENMADLGPFLYDGVVTYEHLTFSILNRINNHPGTLRNMRVIYPQPTIVNQHPAVLLWPDDSSRKEQREAARRWIEFLRSKEMQQKAIEHGFRPASPQVSIRTYDVKGNPFLRLRRFGVSFESTLTEPPRLEGKAINELIAIWEDATERN